MWSIFLPLRRRRIVSRRRARPTVVAAAERFEPRCLLAVTVPPDIVSSTVEIDDNVLVGAGAATIEATGGDGGYVQIFGNSRGRIDAVTAGSGQLTLKASNAITVTGAIGSAAPLERLTIWSTAGQPVNLQQAVTLADDLTVTKAGSFTVGGPVSVGDDLTITEATSVLFAGNVTVAGDLTISAATSVTFAGTLTVGGVLTITDATGTTRFTGDVSARGASVTSTSLVQVLGGFRSTGGGGHDGDVTFTTNQINFTTAVIGTTAAAAGQPAATLVIRPRTASRDLTIASPPGIPSGLAITDADIFAIQSGWKRVVFGDEAAGTGGVTVGSIGSQYGGFSQILNTTTIVGGAIEVVQPVDATSAAAYLEFHARSGGITVKAPINQTVAERNDWVRLTAAGPITLAAPVWAGRTASLTTTTGGTVSQGKAAAVTAPALAVRADGAVTLADAGNAFDTIAITTSDDDVVLREDSGYAVGEVVTSDTARDLPASATVTGIAAGAGTVRLVTVSGATSTVSQTHALTAAGLGLEGTGTDWQFGLAANDIGTLAADTGTVVFRDADDLTVGTVAAVASQAALAGIDVERTVALTAGTTLTITAVGAIVSASPPGIAPPDRLNPAALPESLVAVDLFAPLGISTAADVTTAGADVRFNDQTTLTDDVAIDVVDNASVGTVSLLAAVNAAQAGQEALAVTGNLDARASIGGTTALEALSVSGDSTFAAAVVLRTVGDQTYSGTATSTGTVTVQAGEKAAVKFLGDTTLQGLVTATADTANYAVVLTAAKVVISDAVTLATTGPATLGDGADDDLWFKGGITSTAPVTTSLAGTIRTADAAATFGQKAPAAHAITLTADTTVSTGTGTTTFAGAVDGARRLVVNASGDTVFSSPVGSTTALAHLETDAPGRTLLDGGAVTTASPSSQVYNDAVSLGVDTILTASGGGGITFNDTLDGGHALTVNTQGATTFAKAVGGTQALVSLVTDAGGTTAIDGGSVATTGSVGQVFNDAVSLGAATTLSAARGGAVTFGDTLDGGHALAVNTQGATTFAKAVGGTQALVSLVTDTGGTTAINGGAVVTSGLAGQVFNDAVSLGAATTLTAADGGAVTFGGTLDGGQSLAVNTQGATTFAKAVGGTQALVSLVTDAGGTTAIDGGSIATSGSVGQVFNDAVSLGAATTLTAANGGAVTFGDTLDGGHALTVNTQGATTFAKAVGGTQALASLVTDAGGTTAIDGGSVATSGLTGQAFNDAVSLGAATTLTAGGAGAITFAGLLDGAHSLTANTAGTTTFAGAVGSQTALSHLETDADGETVLGGGAVTTSSPSSQVYNDVVKLTAPTTLTARGGGGITFAKSLDGAHALAVNTAGRTTFGGIVGGDTPLVSLTTDAGGSTALDGGAVTTSGDQHWLDDVAMSVATSFVSTGGAIGGGAKNVFSALGRLVSFRAATGIGTASTPIRLAAAGVTATITGPSGGIYLVGVGDLVVASPGLSAPGAAWLAASGRVYVPGDSNVVAGGGVDAPQPIVWGVNRTDDTGPGSLRQVLANINRIGDVRGSAADAVLAVDVFTVAVSPPVEIVFPLDSPLPEIRAAVQFSAVGAVLDGGSRVATGLVYGTQASGSSLQFVTLRNFTGYGIQLLAARDVVIDRVTVRGLNLVTSMGLYATGDLTNSRVLGSTFTGGLRGALLDQARNLRIGSTASGQGNAFTDNKAVPGKPNFAGTGIRAQGVCTGTVVEGNTFSGNNYGFGFVAARGLALRRNAFARNSIAAIHIDGNCTGSSQSGNTFATAPASRNKATIVRTRTARGL